MDRVKVYALPLIVVALLSAINPLRSSPDGMFSILLDSYHDLRERALELYSGYSSLRGVNATLYGSIQATVTSTLNASDGLVLEARRLLNEGNYTEALKRVVAAINAVGNLILYLEAAPAPRQVATHDEDEVAELLSKIEHLRDKAETLLRTSIRLGNSTLVALLNSSLGLLDEAVEKVRADLEEARKAVHRAEDLIERAEHIIKDLLSPEEAGQGRKISGKLLEKVEDHFGRDR